MRHTTDTVLLTVVVALVAMSAVPAGARLRRSDRDVTMPDSVDTATMRGGDVPARESVHRVSARPVVPLTFLDSVNSGHEVCLTEGDIAGVQGRQSGFKERARDTAVPVTGAFTPAAPRGNVSKREVYRIQCMAATQYEGVEPARDAIRAKLPYPVHIMHVPPYYKLLVGEFPTRAEAEKALYDVRGCGYPDAWIVRGLAGESPEPGSARP